MIMIIITLLDMDPQGGVQDNSHAFSLNNCIDSNIYWNMEYREEINSEDKIRSSLF